MMSREVLPVNIGNPTEMTMLKFARAIRTATGSKSKLVFRRLPQDDPKQRRPDIGRAKRLLKWTPKVGLEEGLRRTIEYFGSKVF
jgi:nucleoside-diphosphate-sugar epimerase